MLPNPEIIGVPISWYTLIHRMSIIVALLFIMFQFYRERSIKMRSWQMFGLSIALVVIGYSGARLFAVLANLSEIGGWNKLSLIGEQLYLGGFRWYGTLFLFILLYPIYVKIFGKQIFGKVFDITALTFCLFTILVKQACQFSGDGCYGIYTNLPWGMYYPYGNAPNLLPVHPTPVYDSLFHLVFFGFLLHFRKKARFDGQTGMLFYAGTALFNILLETIRINPKVFSGLTFAQISYFIILLISVVSYQKIKTALSQYNYL